MNQMKTLQQMEELLQKFYDGATTAAEERTLQEFLTSAHCPEDWAVHREVFSALPAATEVPVPTDLAARIAAAIRPRRMPWLRRWLSVAVSAAAVVAVGFIFFAPSEQPQPAVCLDTCKTPEEAAVEVERAFMLLSQVMNQGIELH